LFIPKKLKAKLKKKLDELGQETPGERFQDRYHAAHARGGNPILRKFLFFGGGLLVIAIGIVMLPAPGPGMVVIAIGASMMARESLAMAKGLDRLEVWGRKAIKDVKHGWKQSSQTTKVSAIVALAACAAGLIYGSVSLFTSWRGR
jgi:hypothetical protein